MEKKSSMASSFVMLKTFALCLVIVGLLSPSPAKAALPSKVKAMLTTCAYGTVGGALLGLASMAFGTKPIAVAQGASIGLWAGLAFGSYVVLSHHYEQNKSRYVSPGEEDQEAPIYPGGGSPYDDAGAVEVDTYGSPQYREQNYHTHPWGLRQQERRASFSVFQLSF